MCAALLMSAGEVMEASAESCLSGLTSFKTTSGGNAV